MCRWKKPKHLFVEPLKCVSEELCTFAIMYFVEGIVWGKLGVCQNMLCSLCLCSSVSHVCRPVPGTAHVMGPGGWRGTAARQVHPAVKGDLMGECCVFCHRSACTATAWGGTSEFWSYDGRNYQFEEKSKMFITLECCQKWFITRKKTSVLILMFPLHGSFQHGRMFARFWFMCILVQFHLYISDNKSCNTN